MKKKLALLLLAAVSCVCFAFGFSACGGDDTATPPGGTTDNTGGTTTTTHTMTFTAAKSATCTEAGNSAYYYCSDCGKYFSDANGTTEIQLSSTVIEALGHDYEAKFTWTSATDGYTATATQTCSRCNEAGETVDATVEITSQVAATCTEKGSTVYTATAAFSGGTETDTKTITDAATGHTYSTEWSYDGSDHWHAAICEHTDEVSDKESHTYKKDPNTGNYVCSVCGYEIDGASTGGGTSGADITLAVGPNYITLGATSTSDDGMENDSSYITGVTFTATESGTYTFSIPTDCQALIYIYDTYNTLYRVGYSGYSNPTYSVEFDLAAGESLDINTIRPAEGVTLDSDYTFCLTIGYVYKDVSGVGTANNPYAFTNPNSYSGDSTTATLEAGESYYFSVTSDSDILSQISFSYSTTDSATGSSLELYADGTKVDCAVSSSEYDETTTITGKYYFSSGTKTITFYVKNTGTDEISATIYCKDYSPSLSVDAENEVTITSAMLDSENSITYTVTFSASTTYSITLGSGTDSAVAVYYTGYSGYETSELILGSGSTATSYQLANTRESYSKTFYLTFTYTGDTVPDSFKVYINFEKVEATDDGSSATYTAITLGESLTMNFNNASTFYYSYTPAATESGNYTFTLTFTTTAFYSTLVGLATVTVNGSTITGSYDSNGVYFVMAEGAAEYKISITLTNATMTLTGSLTSGGEVIEDTTPELSLGANTVANSTLYKFTSTDAGTYTFTLSGAGDYAVISSSDSYTDNTNYYNAQGEDNNSNPFTLELEANQTINLYISGANNSFTLTISNS